MIYKSGQGVAARVTAASLLGALTLFGVYRFHQIYQNVDSWGGQGGVVGMLPQFVFPLLVLALGMFTIWFFTNRPRQAEHLIAAEIELKKVVWPSRDEILRATGIVLIVMVLMGAILFVADLFLQWLLFAIF